MKTRSTPLEAALSDLTDDDVANLEKVLGTEKAQRLVPAAVRMLR